MSVFERIGEKSSQIKEKEKLNKNEVIKHYEFNFENVDDDVKDFLLNQTYEIHNTLSKSYTKLGKIFKETQDELSGNNQYDGIFSKWFSSLGFKKDFVYRLISRYNLLIAFCDKQSLIESLPISLSYEISKESCSEELRNKVLNGEISSLKELKAVSIGNKEDNQKLEIIDFENTYKNFKAKINKLPNILNKLSETKKIKLEKEIEKLYLKIEKLIEETE